MSHIRTPKNSILAALLIFLTAFLSLSLFASEPAGSNSTRFEEADVFSKCWEYKINSNLGVGMATDASTVYIVDNENNLQSVELTLGNKVWSSELGGEVVSNLLVLGEAIYLVTNSQKAGVANAPGKTILRALSRQTGITEWRTEIPSSPTVWLGSTSSNVAAVGSNGSIFAVTQDKGDLAWKTDLTTGVASEPYFDNAGIELGTARNEVIRISGVTGGIQVLWKSEHLPTAVLVEPSGRLLVGDDRGNITSVSSDRDRLWSFRNGAQISSASLHGSEYLAASYDNFVYKLSRSGDVKWKRRLSGRVNDRLLIIGDTAVTAIVGTGSVYVLDLRNGKILNRIETGDEVSLRVAAAKNDRGFVFAGPRSLSYFSGGKCVAK